MIQAEFIDNMENEPNLEPNQPVPSPPQSDNSSNKKSLSKKLSLVLVAVVIIAISATSAFFVLNTQQQEALKKAETNTAPAIKKIQPGTIGSIEANIKSSTDSEQKLDDQAANSEVSSVNEEVNSAQTLEASYEN